MGSGVSIRLFKDQWFRALPCKCEVFDSVDSCQLMEIGGWDSGCRVNGTWCGVVWLPCKRAGLDLLLLYSNQAYGRVIKKSMSLKYEPASEPLHISRFHANERG